MGNIQQQISDFDEMSFGALEGKSKLDADGCSKELQRVKDEWKKGNFSAQFPDGGESPIDVYTRGVNGLQSLISKITSFDINNDEKNSRSKSSCVTSSNIAIVSHSRFLKILLSHVIFNDLSKN